MKKQGLFPLEPVLAQENSLFTQLEALGDLQYAMSGRCGIYHCLLDILKNDKKRVAYLPAYT